MPKHAQATSFADFDLQPDLHRALAAQGFQTPTPIQARAIPALVAGQDVIGQARTGSGKTLAFLLPLVGRAMPGRRAVQALVLVPTRELALQVGSVLGPLADTRRLRHTLLYGGRSLGPEERSLHSAQIVVGTPGRTLDHLRRGSLALDQLSMLVLDEADEMLDRGFAPDVERILAHAPDTRQTALFSATLPAWVAGIAARHVQNAVTIEIDAHIPAPPEIEHLVYDIQSTAKLDALRTLLNRRGDESVIVFGRTKHGVKKLAQRLEALGYPAAALQGNLSQNARERVMTNFRSGEVPILLATNVAARGLDVPEVGQVINYELPESAEWFTHRVGRTGRMGRAGRAITLLTPDDAAQWRQFEKVLGRRLERRPWAHSADAAVGAAPSSGPAVRARPAARTTPAPAGTPRPSAAPAPPGTPGSPARRVVRAEPARPAAGRSADFEATPREPRATSVGRAPAPVLGSVRGRPSSGLVGGRTASSGAVSGRPGSIGTVTGRPGSSGTVAGRPGSSSSVGGRPASSGSVSGGASSGAVGSRASNGPVDGRPSNGQVGGRPSSGSVSGRRRRVWRESQVRQRRRAASGRSAST